MPAGRDPLTAQCAVLEDGRTYRRPGTDGHVDRFSAHAGHQGRGIGAALMRAVAEDAERIGVTRLLAEVSTTARPFFQCHGFVALVEQQVVVRGVSLTHFRIGRLLGNR